MTQFKKALFVVGPTASGKSAFAHTLVERQRELGCAFELVNIDAFQFYRGVSIGTAKPSPEELQKYKYHGVDILDVTETIDAARYAEFVWTTCQEVNARGAVPICVGGSGLYLRAALHGLDALPPRNDSLREMFRASAVAWGWPELHRWLSALAPIRAAELHPNDKTRIERALEIAFQLPEGVTLDSILSKSARLSEQTSVGDAFLIHVDCSDEVLKERIYKRLHNMFEQGWVAEVESLQARFGQSFTSTQSFRAIGYPAIWSWLQEFGNCSEASGSNFKVTKKAEVDLLKVIATQTWQYVRRQRTWNAKEQKDWLVDSTYWNGTTLQFIDKFVDFLSK
ncbi:MAG: hypothetical protein RJB13_2382 [Pseudomonadota bacterium]